MPARLLVAAEKGRFELIVSEHLLSEVQDVLERPKMRRYLPVEEISDYLERISDIATVVEGPAPSDVVPDDTLDPDDDYLIELCFVGVVECLVSGDRHLLSLETNMDTKTAIPILTPREFLEQLKRQR